MATIKASDAKRIAASSKEEGRETLAAVLNWPQFDEDKQMQIAIHLDFLHDVLMFATGKGFHWDKVASVVNFADKFVQQFKGCEKITDILGFYNSQTAHLLDLLGERDYKVFSDFIFETVLPHFKLFQHVFNVPREEQIPYVTVKVDPPFDPSILKDSKAINVWEYERRIGEIEEKEKERLKELSQKKNQEVAKLDSDVKSKLETVSKPEKSFDAETIKNIIEEVVNGLAVTTTEGIKHDIERMQEDLEFKLEKTSLPRPQVLGPPPRYQIQPVKSSASKVSKSPKPGSRMSSRSKKK